MRKWNGHGQSRVGAIPRRAGFDAGGRPASLKKFTLAYCTQRHPPVSDIAVYHPEARQVANSAPQRDILLTIAAAIHSHENVTVQDRGIVLLPELRPVGDERFRVGDPLRLRRPDGSEGFGPHRGPKIGYNRGPKEGSHRCSRLPGKPIIRIM